MGRLSPNDPNSFSRPDEVIVKHIDLDWKVDFGKKSITASCDLTIEKIEKASQHVVLDTRDLEIVSIKNKEDGSNLTYELGSPVLTFGSELKVKLPKDDKTRYVLSIEYKTSPCCSALQWLSPEQTSGKKYPYVFSQCQPIHCRSFIPCQDTPGVKITYNASVLVPKEYVALMSALRDGQETQGDHIMYKFRQPIAIPSYLVAIVVGDLESRKIGPRSNVWSERELVDKAAEEFSDTETMISTAESICGPYVWTQYDLLVLPPSFPYGGMENPCLTFVTPTLLAGDKSLVDVVAHEISHSWTGNLVTNNQWEHFWLNEGFTMFLERKICGRMHGDLYRHFDALGGWKSLADCIRTRGETDPLTCLIPDLTDVDPDDAFSSVPYEKGHTFLWYLEQLLGGPDKFEPFLRAYLEKFKFKSIDSTIFKEFLFEYFSDKSTELSAVDWKAWCYTPGMPPVKPKFDTSIAEVCTALCKRWTDWDDSAECSFKSNDLEDMTSNQIEEWLSQLLEEEALSVKKLEKMEDLYKMSDYANCEIKFRWLKLCVKGHWKDKIEPALHFITIQGRMKYVRPLYRELYKWEEARSAAIENFKKHKDSMMHVASHQISKDLHLTS